MVGPQLAIYQYVNQDVEYGVAFSVTIHCGDVPRDKKIHDRATIEANNRATPSATVTAWST